MDQRKIGTFLKSLRQERGITQEQLAEKLNVAGRTVSRWETGANMPDFDVLIELADYYEVDVRELLEGERKDLNAEIDRQVLRKVSAYNRAREKALIRNLVLITVIGILAWTATFFMLSELMRDVRGGSLIMGGTLIGGAALSCLISLCFRVNRTAAGYQRLLLGLLIAIVDCNMVWFAKLFWNGDYSNPGMAGVWYVVLTGAGIFALYVAVVTWLNYEDFKENR